MSKKLKSDIPLDAADCSAVLLTSVDMYDGDGWMPVMNVDHQSFAIDYVAETKADCDWYCNQMRTALKRAGCRVIQQNVESIHPESKPVTPCSLSFGGYLPESWPMLKDSVYAAQEAIRAGIENTQELMADHDVILGRTTRSNRYTAERLEGEIRQMQAALDGLQKPNGCRYGESSPMAPDGVRRQVDISPENNQDHAQK